MEDTMEGVVATSGRTGLAVSADGKVSVDKEVTMTALARDEEGNVFLRVFRARTRQVVGQVSGIFAIPGSEREPAPSRHHYVTVSDDDDDDAIPMREKMCVFIFCVIFCSLPVAMMSVGIIELGLCPGYTGARLAIYMIVQGASSVLIPILAFCWYCFRCYPGTCIGVICVIIGLFNVAWGIAGSVWLASSPCKDTLLFTHALGFSVPMWIFFCLVTLVFVVRVMKACCKDDD